MQEVQLWEKGPSWYTCSIAALAKACAYQLGLFSDEWSKGISGESGMYRTYTYNGWLIQLVGLLAAALSDWDLAEKRVPDPQQVGISMERAALTGTHLWAFGTAAARRRVTTSRSSSFTAGTYSRAEAAPRVCTP
jgi:hypothetical protein